MDAQEPEPDSPRKTAQILALGGIITSNIVGGIVFGHLLDRWLQMTPWLLLAGLLLGLGNALRQVLRLTTRL